MARLEERLGYRFSEPELAGTALQHRSGGEVSNERLEFLGDAVIALAVAEWLFEHKPELAEGDLTRMRASLVKSATLACVAGELRLGELLKLGRGERRRPARASRSMLEDAFEAVIGAVFRDGGYASARKVVQTLFASRLRVLPDAEALKDSKTRLQERLQARGFDLPGYTLLGARGPQHAREFEIECAVAELSLACTARGASKREAEQRAAEAVLQRLER